MYKAIVQAMLKDREFMAGGIFSKEQYYMEKYKLTQNQISEMQGHVYQALRIKQYENRIK